ncbi:MAG: single-strand DNA-binding protein [Frankiales bacterium]|jgi:single-strand DNA-binding protein|nr:single-strand DNA-binding protein [Frankiales bacterium]
MNDNQISIVGNIVRDPALKRVSDKALVTTFRLASTPRRFDSTASEWVNLDSLYLTVNCWNKLAERVAGCLKGGDPVVVCGRLRMRTYEVDGQKRTVYEVDAQQVAPDLNRVSVAVDRTGRRSVEAVPDQAREATAFESSVKVGPLVPLAAEPAA